MNALAAIAALTVLSALALGCGAGGGDRPSGPVDRGRELFMTPFTAAHGLGPLFNGRSCASCHRDPRPGGVGRAGLATVSRVGRRTAAGFHALGVAHEHATAGCDEHTGVPAGANVVSIRNAPALFGDGRIDAIPDAAIRAGERRHGPITGRANLVREAGRLRVGRFGWKAATPTLEQFVAVAFRDELGVTNPRAQVAVGGPCGSTGTELGARAISDVATFVASLSAPRPLPRRADAAAGAALFASTGCAACHTPNLSGVALYSDLLLHDMGPLLDDGVTQGRATGREWRTAPLWGLHERPRLLHDGRADSLPAAILAHGGEATGARRRFAALNARDRASLLGFLESL